MAQVDDTTEMLKLLALAIGLFKSDVGRLPQDLEELVDNPGEPEWSGPYIIWQGEETFHDAWGQQILYTLGLPFELRSAGAGRICGDDDDIVFGSAPSIGG